MYEHLQSTKSSSLSISPLDWEYPFISKNGVKPITEKLESKSHSNSGSFLPENRWQSSFYERENIWGEIRLYSEHLRRYASESPHPEVTREKFFEIYNLAVGLLRAIDCLDPDYKMRKLEQSFPFQQLQSSSDNEYFSRKSIEMRREFPPLHNFPPHNNNSSSNSSSNNNNNNHHDGPPPLMFQQNQYPPAVPLQNQMQVPMKNLTGEVFFDDIVDSDRYPKRKRKKPLYSVNRNLYCHICFVRETPEWRRGPDGDHTLCNACGLHYAKNQKKEKLSREGRKYSIEMLLCENNSTNSNTSNSTSSSSNSHNSSNSSPVTLSSSSSFTSSSTTTTTTSTSSLPTNCNTKANDISNQTPSPRRSFDNSRYSFKTEKSILSPEDNS